MLENLKIAEEYDGFLFLAESVRNPPALRPHHHLELELNLVAAGSITYVLGGQRFTFDRGTLLWLFSDQEHQLVDRTPKAAYYVAVFKPDLIERACRSERYAGLRERDFSIDGVLHAKLGIENFDLLRRIMDGIVAEGMDPDLLNREAGFGLSPGFSFRHKDPDWLNAGLRHLLLQSWRLQQDSGETAGRVSLHPAVQRALDYLNENDEAASVSSLAQHCGISQAYLSRVFHRQIGVPLNRYRNSLRLSRFWEAYRDRRTSTLLDAVLTAGFGSYAQFYRVFKEAYGQGPRDAGLRK